MLDLFPLIWILLSFKVFWLLSKNPENRVIQ